VLINYTQKNNCNAATKFRVLDWNFGRRRQQEKLININFPEKSFGGPQSTITSSNENKEVFNLST
jgi:hypothetical protein